MGCWMRCGCRSLLPIFNPVSQGQKFDPEGTYTKQFVPELKDLPAKYLFSPGKHRIWY